MSARQVKRVIIMAGGTGGHVFPALAVAKTLIDSGVEVHWLGTEKGIESRIVPENNIPITYLNVAGVRGQGLKRLLQAPFKIARAVMSVITLMRTFKPDFVLGMGGFVTGPGGVGAKLAGVPLVIHEQNAIAGFTNKVLARFANKILQAFPGAFTFGAAKTMTTGNPVRNEIQRIDHPDVRFAERSGPLRILILGGSQGAVALNKMVPKALALVSSELQLADKQVFEILHQAGRSNHEETRGIYSQCGIEAEVVPFLQDMDVAYAWADLVICRSGALTVAELAMAGVGAVLVPYPFAVDDHQTKNAEYLASNAAALIVQQNAINAEALAELILDQQLLNRDCLLRMAQAARDLASPDATHLVIQACEEVVNVK